MLRIAGLNGGNILVVRVRSYLAVDEDASTAVGEDERRERRDKEAGCSGGELSEKIAATKKAKWISRSGVDKGRTIRERSTRSMLPLQRLQLGNCANFAQLHELFMCHCANLQLCTVSEDARKRPSASLSRMAATLQKKISRFFS